MIASLRAPAALMPAALVTAGLFWFMHVLISDNAMPHRHAQATASIVFGPARIELPEPTPSRSLPPRQRTTAVTGFSLPMTTSDPPARGFMELNMNGLPGPLFVPDLTPLATHGPCGAQCSGEGNDSHGVIPTVRITPQYPHQAAIAGLEGEVTVSFTILPSGDVANARVVRSTPGRVFDNEALRAIRRWKFRPLVVDGRAVATTASQTLVFRF